MLPLHRQDAEEETMTQRGYDVKCYELAVAFLEDHCDPVPVLRAQELAQVIQDAIEDWLSGEGIT